MKKNILLILIISVLLSCKHIQKGIKVFDETNSIILVSKDNNQIFDAWLNNSINGKHIKCFNMFSIRQKDSIEIMLKQANGIIISGGEDVNPVLYNKGSEIKRCGDIDSYRDSLEQVMINYALINKIPLLGICRGHQIINVTMGGSLIIDIPEDIGTDSLHRNNGRTNHMVYIEKNSFLYRIVQVDSGMILSNHHQAVDKLAPKLKKSSYAADKVIESIELLDTLVHPFILGVQWHPEGMNIENPLSGKIGKKFINKAIQHFYDQLN